MQKRKYCKKEQQGLCDTENLTDKFEKKKRLTKIFLF